MTTMAWRLAASGGTLSLDSVGMPELRPGSALVRMEAVPLLSYLGAYTEGKLPYWYPPGPFTPGTNGVGVVETVGPGVYHLTPGQRVYVSPHLLADEVTDEPAQVLIGLTGISPESGLMLAAWRDGTLAEHGLMPAAVLSPLAGLDHVPAERLATLGKFTVPLGGLLRGRLAAGETLVVNGASGYFGSAAVLLGLALGAERVIAVARGGDALDDLARKCGARVVPVALSGDAGADAKAIRAAACGRGAHLAFDQVGNATDPNSTLAALGSLRRGGRLVLMGSMTGPLPLSYGDLMVNDWEVIGNFMYARTDALLRLPALVRSGLLDLDLVSISSFDLKDLPEAMRRAAAMRGLECTVVRMGR